jgi:SAM-dependent methyltransferase
MATRQLPAHQSMTRSFLVWLLSVAPYNRRTNMDRQIFFTIQAEINSDEFVCFRQRSNTYWMNYIRVNRNCVVLRQFLMKLRKTEPISCGLSIFSGLIYPTTTCFFPTPSGAGRRRTISVDGWTWNRPGVAGKRVLDCGCGPGRHTWALAHLGAQVTAFDMSDSGLAEAKRECANYPTAIIEKRNIFRAASVLNRLRYCMELWGDPTHRRYLRSAFQYCAARKARRSDLLDGLSRTRTHEF